MQVVSWPKSKYGQFFSGDSFIVLKTNVRYLCIKTNMLLSHEKPIYIRLIKKVNILGTYTFGWVRTHQLMREVSLLTKL
jgi:hypothetical protein